MAYRTIHLKENGDGGVKKEALASGSVYPGMILERTNASADTVKAHSQAGRKTGPVLIAIEDELQGNGVSTVYATATRVFFRACKPGDEVVVRCANGQSITKGDRLTSNGDGYMKKLLKDSSAVVDEGDIFGTALETIDMSDSSAADPSSDMFLMEAA